MRILGISISFERKYKDFLFKKNEFFGHDTSAVLIDDKKIIAAVEQERFDRIKHSDSFPSDAIKYCLSFCNNDFSKIDYIAINYEEMTLDSMCREIHFQSQGNFPFIKFRDYFEYLCKQNGLSSIPLKKLVFVSHQLSHVNSAVYCTDFDNALCISLDARGDDLSGLICSYKNKELTILKKLPVEKSLGFFYLNTIWHIGFRQFEEYKVMGLAPFGNPAKFRNIFKRMIYTKENGEFEISPNCKQFLYTICPPRKRNEDIKTIHKDIAAALQEALENVIMNMVEYYAKEYNLNNLILSGGVAHNCAATGKIIQSKKFDKVFVQPAAHDAGTALGAAIESLKDKSSFSKMETAFLGPELCTDNLEKIVNSSNGILKIEKKFNNTQELSEQVSTYLADGKVFAICQGRSEFGPRALGNRSIVADSRFLKTKNKINIIIKNREEFRPFAPFIAEEKLNEYYIIDSKMTAFPYMNTIMPIKKSYVRKMQAVTNVDNTSRVQTVNQEQNPIIYNILKKFGEKTGIYALLNTSYNTDVEPIVQTLENAIQSFLLTEIDYLLVENYLIKKESSAVNFFIPHNYLIPPHVELIISKNKYFMRKTSFTSEIEISKEAFNFLINLISFDNTEKLEITNITTKEELLNLLKKGYLEYKF